jgi:hypothetical protein
MENENIPERKNSDKSWIEKWIEEAKKICSVPTGTPLAEM